MPIPGYFKPFYGRIWVIPPGRVTKGLKQLLNAGPLSLSNVGAPLHFDLHRLFVENPHNIFKHNTLNEIYLKKEIHILFLRPYLPPASGGKPRLSGSRPTDRGRSGPVGGKMWPCFRRVCGPGLLLGLGPGPLIVPQRALEAIFGGLGPGVKTRPGPAG